MREIRDLLHVLGRAESASSRPLRRSAQQNRWQQRLDAVLEAITEHWPYEAIWVRGNGVSADDNGILRPELEQGTSGVYVDAYEFWSDEGYPELEKYVQNDLYDNLVQEFSDYIDMSSVIPTAPTEEPAAEAESVETEETAPSTVYDLIYEYGNDHDRFMREVYPIIEAIHLQKGEAPPQVEQLEQLYKNAVCAISDWYHQISWSGGYPTDSLEEDFLSEDADNWLVSDEYVVNVGSGFAGGNSASFDDFLEATQQRIDEASEEENQIEEFDYQYDDEFTYRNPLFDEFTAQLEGLDALTPDVARKLIASLPKYVQSQLSRLIEERVQKKEPITAEFLTEELDKFNLNFTVERGDERYLGATMTGSPFTFCFDRTHELDQTINRIGQAAKYIWDRSKWSHYDQAVAYVRIDGNRAPVQTGDGKQLSGFGWVIENIQSDPMRNITDYMGSAGAERRKDLAERLQISKSDVERQVNRLSNYLSEWPFALAQYLEGAAQQNEVAYLIWTDSKFQMDRWGGLNEGSAKYYYDKIPELLGYEHHDKLYVFGEKVSAWIKKIDGVETQAPANEDENAQP